MVDDLSRDVFDGPSRRLPEASVPPRRPRLWVHALLFFVTFLSATWSQSMDWAGAGTVSDLLLSPLRSPARLADGLLFAFTLMAILLAHEMGHYLTARRYGVDQSLPYFIPAPTLFGTFGAVILMRSQPPSRRVLLKVAVMGPYAGMLLALPAAAWGLAHSTPIEATGAEGALGESLLWQGLDALFGPEAEDIVLHPIGLAGWAGLFVTSLNLIPAAQLDGGHVAYALFGRRQALVSKLVVGALLLTGVVMGMPEGTVWIVWAVLLTLIGLKHPPVRDEALPLLTRDRVSGYLALALFVLTFMPVPLSPGGSSEIDAGPPEEFRLDGTGEEDDDPGGPPEEFRL